MSNPNQPTDQPIPLCVDLDGTLIYSDALYEVLLVLLRKNVLYLLLLPLWVLRGKAHFKHKLAEHGQLDPTELPYNPELLDYLREQHQQGRQLVLATATHRSIAERIAEHVGIFDRVLASDAEINLSGHRKLKRLKEEYGANGFDYAGNGHIDLDVWPETRRALVVNPDAGVLEAAEKIVDIEKVFPAHGRTAWYYLRSLRLLLWAKNLLLLVPLIASAQLTDPRALLLVAVAFIAFSLSSSAAYLLNDLLDLPADRRHPHNRHRPLAASTVPLLHGLLLIPVLLLPALLISLLLPLQFLLWLLLYLLLNAAYSLWFKRLPLLDIVTLTALYLLRLLAGAAAIGVTLPGGLLLVSALLFLSMAAAKRYAHLNHIDPPITADDQSHHYHRLLAVIGISSGMLSAALLAVHAAQPPAQQSYAHPSALWLVCALLAAWVGRLWSVTRNGQLLDDPVVFAISDRVSLGLLAALVATWLLAANFGQ